MPPPVSLVQTATLLRETQPWVRFMGIMGFVSVALMVLVGLGMGAFGLAGGRPEMMVLVIVYPLMGLLYFFPSLYLVRYASRIAAFNGSQQVGDLEAALSEQKAFWRFVGILTVVGLVLTALMFVLAIALPFVLRG